MILRFPIAVFIAVLFLVFLLVPSGSAQASTDSLSNSSDTFKVALLLPLHMDQLDQLDTVPDQSAQLVPSSIPALHFFEAALMFRDSVAAKGRSVELHVMDVCQDTSSIMKQLNLLRGAKYDAILSMLPLSFQPYLTSASLRWKTPVFVFQASNNSPLQKSEWLRLVLPSNNTQIRVTAQRLADSFPTAVIHTVFRDQRNEREVARLFKSVIDSVSLDSMRCRPFHYKGQAWTAFTGKLVSGKANVVIVPTIDESFLSSFLNAIEPVRKDYEIVLCGMPAWEGFESIDPALLQEMKTILFNGYFIDSRSVTAKEFRKAFVNEYHADPLPQAYMAWDALALAFSEWLGIDSSNVQPVPKLMNIHGALEPVCETCGKENRQVQILEYLDFELRPLGGDKNE